MGKKGKKTKEKKATPAEAFIQFQIDVKRKEIEAYEEEVKELEARNQKLVEQRDLLREEQQGHLGVLHKQVKAQEKKLEENEVAKKEQIHEAAQNNLELVRSQKEELEVNIECSLKAAICKIEKNTTQLIEREKQLSSERALKQVDENSLQEIKKNDWLKKEIDVYHEEVSVLDGAVKNLEKENLEHMKDLFEYRRIDAQISSSGLLMHTGVSEKKRSFPEKAAEIGKEQHQQFEELEEDKLDHSCKPFFPTHQLGEHMYGSQGDLGELAHLGPLEQRLLDVDGMAKPLYPLPSDSEDLDTLTHLGLFHAQDGTLTTKIIRKKFQ